MDFFIYGETEIAHLKKKDKRLGAFIERTGFLRRETTPDLFNALVSSIISQQISGKAADTILARLTTLCGEICPESIADAGAEAIQKCGTSNRKAGYIVNAADAVLSGRLDLASLKDMPDSDAVETLSALHGIGVWTAEMLLLFSLGRPDILSYGDLAIRKGMMKLYGHKNVTKELFERYRRRYSPYGSVASLYLWEASVV